MNSRASSRLSHSTAPNQRDYVIPSEQRMIGFQKYIGRYAINQTFARKLLALNGYEIVFICDDSSSMNTPLGDVHGPYSHSPTRWDELKQTVSIVVDLASVLDPNGVDVYFLNRKPILNVRSSEELIPVFAVRPKGATPIARVLREVLRAKHDEIQNRSLLILLATDGVPTDDYGRADIRSLENVLRYDRVPTRKIPVTIIVCTDDAESMRYLNVWDRGIPNLDVVDDYRNEKKEILKCQGNDFPFEFGDYVVKILLGGIDEWFDQLDEKKVSLD